MKLRPIEKSIEKNVLIDPNIKFLISTVISMVILKITTKYSNLYK